MGLPEPVIEHQWGAAPAPGPIAGWWDDPDRLEIAMPGLGAIRVDPDRIVVTAPSEEAAGKLVTRLGSWARAHWWILQGFTACRATVVGRDGRAIALIGIERTGASLLALALIEHGWSVISDGLAVFDPHGLAMHIPGPVTIDAGPAAHLRYDLPQVRLAAGRERVGVLVPAHPSARLSGYVAIRARRSIPSLIVRGPVDPFQTPPGPTSGIASCRVPARELPAGRWWRVDRPIPEHLAAMRESAPSVIASLLAPLLVNAAAGQAMAR